MKFQPLAVFLGVLADLAFSFVAGFMLLIPFGIHAINSPSYYFWSLVLGLAAVAMGGYVTSWRSSSDKFLNSCIFLAIQILISIAGVMLMPMPLWFTAATFVLVTPAALLGSFLAKP